MTDSNEIHALLSDDDYNKALTSYTDVQYEYLQDLQMGVYSGNIISFDTLSLREKWISWRDAYLAVPITIAANGGTALATDSVLAFKRSAADIINGFTLQTGNGATLVSDQNIQLVNHIRNLVEMKYQDWLTQSGDLIFQKDQAKDQVATGVVFPNTVVADNVGLAKRVTWLKQDSKFASATYSTVLTIPLRFIHDIFEKMDYPICNMRLLFTFYVNTQNSGVSMNPVLGPIGGNTENYLVNIVGGSSFAGSATTLTGCRLYYKTVKYSPEVNRMLAQKLQSGFKKNLSFRITDTYLASGSDVAVAASSAVDKLVSASTTAPLKVWFLASPTATITGASQGRTLSLYTGKLRNANILVNNTRYYDQNLDTPRMFYDIIRDSMQAGDIHEGLINFNDWIAGYALHCFDLTRLGNKMRNPSEAVSLQVQATRDVDGQTADHHYVVERLQKVQLNLSSGESSVIVGLNAF